jgi:hypothetical protein
LLTMNCTMSFAVSLRGIESGLCGNADAICDAIKTEADFRFIGECRS